MTLLILQLQAPSTVSTSESPAQENPRALNTSQKEGSSFLLLRFGLSPKTAACGVATAACALLLIAAPDLLLPATSPAAAGSGTDYGARVLGGSSAPAAFMLVLSAVVIGPLTEEIVFRGLLLPSMAVWMGLPSALLGSSIAFAMWHMSVTDLPSLTVLGLCLAACCVGCRGNLAGSVLAHSLYNAFALGAAWGAR